MKLKNFGRLFFSLLLFCAHGIVAAGFKWEAGLNSISGLAYSLERSSLSRSRGTMASYQTHKQNDDNDPDLSRKVKELFTSYPQFLGLRKCLLGAFVAKPSCLLGEKGNPESLIATTQICDFLFGINLLTFGQPTTVTYRSRKKNEKIEGSYSIENEVVTDLPVIGGLLSCRNGGRKDGKISCTGSGSPHSSYGLLRFKFTQTCEILPYEDGNPQASQELIETLRLETRVIDYKPALAGFPPVGRMRKSFYSSTQRLLHAYVMWRFHNHCYVNL